MIVYSLYDTVTKVVTTCEEADVTVIFPPNTGAVPELWRGHYSNLVPFRDALLHDDPTYNVDKINEFIANYPDLQWE